ncbi:MAG TPA: type II secretion system minor pseudopilin GspJ [Wenzhouxiangellaceae bacterium]|nr:type II secretion system minor pseudopilin GspJ [Wenzhouxiangellaceae bacterium]
MRPLPSKHSSGFTLVELLVAVLVFGLLAASAYGGLTALSAAVGAQRDRSLALAGLQRAVATLDSDLRQLVSRRGRDRDGRLLPVLGGDSQILLGRRAGRLNPADLPRSQLQQFEWRLEQSVLVRRSWPEVDSAPDTPPTGRTVFDQVTAIEFRFRDSSGAWHRQWPASSPPQLLPSAVEYVIDTPVFGTVRRLVAL